MAAYLTPAELLLFYTESRVMELASDTHLPAVDITNNQIVLKMIEVSSAEFDAMMQQGGRYLRQTLEDICDAARDSAALDSDRKRAAPIQELIAHLTFGRLLSRRGTTADAMRSLCPMYDDAQRRISELATGIEIFDIDAAKDAGKPSVVRIGENGPSLTNSNRLFSLNGSTTGLFPDSNYYRW